MLQSHPDNPLLLYNVACCESLAGDAAGALEHLRRAIELSDHCLFLAKDDSDFDPIRGEPAFQKLIGPGAHDER